MKRIIVMLMTLTLLLSSAVTPLYADAWIPPDDMANERVILSCHFPETCGAINIFISNYIEAGIISLNSSTSDSVVISAMLKHFELNASAYKSAVKSESSAYGRYMMIKGEEFEKRTKLIFSRSIAASSVEGYSNGWIYATAENYDGPIRCFASTTRIEYIEKGTYKANFEIFSSSGDISSCYDTPNNELNRSGLTYLGEGSCYFTFTNTKAESFKPSELTFVSVNSDNYSTPHNTPCTPCNTDGSSFEEESETAKTTKPIADDTTGKISKETERITAKETLETHKSEEGGSANTSVNIILIIIALAILFVAVVIPLIIIIAVVATHKK